MHQRSTSANRLRVRDEQGIRWPLRLTVALTALVVAWVGTGMVAEKWLYTVTAIAIAALLASGLNLVIGYSGQMCLSTGAFMSLGAYLGSLGTGTWDLSGLEVIFVAAAASLALSSLAGLVIFRARGLHFALITAGLSLVTYGALVSWTGVTGGSIGLSTGGPVNEGGVPRPLTLGPISLDSTRDYCLASVVFLTSVLLATTFFVRSRSGVRTVVTRDDEVLAASVGIRIIRYKRLAYTVSCLIATSTGVIYAHWVGYITPSAFTFGHVSFDPLAMVMIGGAGTISGPVVGAVIVAGTPEIFRGLAEYSTLAYGVILLVVVLLSPKGLVGLVKDGFTRIVRTITNRRPS